MLGKLIKHDFKSLSRLLLPTMIAILGATILASLAIRFNLGNSAAALGNSPWAQVLTVISSLLTAVMVMAIIAAFILVLFVIYQHFYKNFMTSQGYLTFTLPTTANCLLWSKLITAMLWLAISAVVGFLCINLFFLIAPSGTGILNSDLFSAYGTFFRSLSEFSAGDLWAIALEILLFAVVGAASSILHVYLALIIGGAVSQKHKLLAGIGFYFVINIAMGVVTSIIQIFFLNKFAYSMSFGNNYLGVYDSRQILNIVVDGIQPYYWTTLGMLAIFGVAFFLLSKYLLKNKLNLE